MRIRRPSQRTLYFRQHQGQWRHTLPPIGLSKPRCSCCPCGAAANAPLIVYPPRPPPESERQNLKKVSSGWFPLHLKSRFRNEYYCLPACGVLRASRRDQLFFPTGLQPPPDPAGFPVTVCFQYCPPHRLCALPAGSVRLLRPPAANRPATPYMMCRTRSSLVSLHHHHACLSCFITSNRQASSPSPRAGLAPQCLFLSSDNFCTKPLSLHCLASSYQQARRANTALSESLPMECCMSQSQCLSSPFSLHQTNLAA